MKFITDRRELANEINIKRTPVLTMNIEHCHKGYENSYSGTKVALELPGRDYTGKCDLYMWGDQPGNTDKHDTPWLYENISIEHLGGWGIAANITLDDYREMVAYNNAPLVREGQEVLIQFDAGSAMWFRKMKVGKVDRSREEARLIDID